MNEERKSIWKAPLRGWSLRLAWGGLVAVVVGVASVISGPPVWQLPLVALVVIILILAIRWLCNWNHFKKFLFGCACLATLFALIHAEETWRGKHDWKKFKHEQEARGMHFDLASIAPAPVPDDQNFAMTPIVKSCYSQLLNSKGQRLPKNNDNVVNRMEMPIDNGGKLLEPPGALGNWEKSELSHLEIVQQYYRDLAAKTNLFAVPSQPGAPARDVLMALSKYDEPIEELRAASHLLYSRFPLDYDAANPYGILLPHLAYCKGVARMLDLRAVAELQVGQADKGMDDVLLALKMGDSFRSEPILISHLVRIVILNLTLQPVYEGLAQHRWNDEQLASLSAQLAKYDYLADFQKSMQGEMALSTGTLEYLRQHREFDVNETDFNNNNAKQRFFSHLLMPDGFFYQNELTVARLELKWLVPVIDVQRHLVFPTLAEKKDLTKALEHFSPYNIFARMLVPALTKSARKFAIAESNLNLACVAIALERYRLAHGEYPEALDSLAPQYLSALPHDIINGKPLHYRREASGLFILYSVGWNQTDDGGKVALNTNKTRTVNKDAGDWVWQYAAGN